MVQSPKVSVATEYGNATSFWVEYPNGLVDVSRTTHLPKGGLAQDQDAPDAVGDSAAAQIIGIAILEFGVLLHSVLIGLTLAVDEQFTILFVVIIFHRKSSWACVCW